jgi:nitrogen fixation/metabolism regulation signal transduction histidine kinase
MSGRERLQRLARDNRWIAGALALALVVLTLIYYLLLRSRDLPDELLDNRVLLFVLGYINLVLILAIGFVLFRNLFKLFLERRNRLLGSKLRTKLVLTYVGLSLVPVILLFVYGTGLLQGWMDRWFDEPAIRQVAEQGYGVAQELHRQVEGALTRDARRALAAVRTVDLRDAASRPQLDRLLRRQLEELGVAFLAVYDGTDFVHGVVASVSGMRDLPEPGRSLLADAVRQGEAVRRLAATPDGAARIVMSAVAAPAALGEPQPVVVAGGLLDPLAAGQAADLIRTRQGLRQLELQRDDIHLGFFLLFLMVTLVILLAVSWAGLYLARRVTRPIEALAEGTRRVAEGDLGYRVDVPADDELGNLVASFNRMTADLERNERELLRVNERLAAERAWSEAARRVAHEIKNPLTPIKLTAERLLKKHAQGDPQLGESLAEGMRIIVREVESMQAMVDEFSRFARMPRPQPAAVDVERLLAETLRLYEGIKPGVSVTGEVAPEAATAWLDGEQVKRALINLLDNAVAAVEAPGAVRVAVERSDGSLRIRVADTGPGIPDEAKEKLFLPHFSTKGRGTGLGLAIVHRIVTEHHGSLRVEDNAPHGAVFAIELPQG